MSRALAHHHRKILSVVGALAIGAAMVAPSLALAATPAAAAATAAATSTTWCRSNGANFARWTGTSPNLPICGPGPAYGGYWGYVDIPGPFGESGVYYNATPGFQCVELAERYLSVIDGLAPVRANGAQVAENYHAAYPQTRLVRDGSVGAIGHPPTAGGVISFSYSSSFSDDGHVAVVVASQVNRRTGDGFVRIAQENVSPRDYVRTLELVHWRLVDTAEGGGTEYTWPAAEWLVVPPPISAATAAVLAARHPTAAKHRALHRFSVLAARRFTSPASGLIVRRRVGVLVSFARR